MIIMFACLRLFEWFSVILSRWNADNERQQTSNKQLMNQKYPFEPPQDKTNKMTARPAKTQISLGIRPFWSQSSLAFNGYLRTQGFFMRTAKTLIWLCGCPGWSESSLGAHVGFVMRQLILRMSKNVSSNHSELCFSLVKKNAPGK